MGNNPERFTKEVTVKAEHLDELNHVNNVQYVQWIQDIAKAHWDARSSKKQNEDFFWVVVKHEVDYKKQAMLGERLLLKTFIEETTHVTSKRKVIIESLDKQHVVVEGISTWCLLDKKTGKPSKISEELKNIFQ